MMAFEDAYRQMLREEIRAAVREALGRREESAPSDDSMLTLAEAAAFSRLGVSTIRSHVASGDLKKYGPPRKRLVKKCELVELLERLAGDGDGAEESLDDHAARLHRRP